MDAINGSNPTCLPSVHEIPKVKKKKNFYKVYIKNKTNICIQDINSFYKMDGCYKWPYSKVYIHAKKRNKKKKRLLTYCS